MEIISTEGYGPNVIYRVRDGELIREIKGKDNLPPGVYMHWRRKTQREGMQKLRNQRKEGTSSNQQPEQIDQPCQQVDPPREHVIQPLIDLTTQTSQVSQPLVDLTTQTSQVIQPLSQRIEQSVGQQSSTQSQPIDLAQRSQSKAELTAKNNEERTARDLLKCKVCTDAQVEKLIIPCGHLVMCSRCLTAWMNEKKVCPVCRQTIKDHFGVILI